MRTTLSLSFIDPGFVSPRPVPFLHSHTGTWTHTCAYKTCKNAWTKSREKEKTGIQYALLRKKNGSTSTFLELYNRKSGKGYCMFHETTSPRQNPDYVLHRTPCPCHPMCLTFYVTSFFIEKKEDVGRGRERNPQHTSTRSTLQARKSIFQTLALRIQCDGGGP